MKLQICDLCKQFDGVSVLDHVSMELESGHIYCLTAPSGKGKTTLFRILMGWKRQTAVVFSWRGYRSERFFRRTACARHFPQWITSS